MSPAPKVVVVGSIMQDLTMSCAAFPARGQTVVGRLTTGQGGKGSNQAVACGRTGMPTLFVGATGVDDFSRKVREFYRRAKIGCRLARKRGMATGTAVILIDAGGQNQIVIEPGANSRLAPKDVPRSVFRCAKVVVTQLESNPETTRHILRAARRAGIMTILNPAPMRDDFDRGLLSDVDILIPNESEFAALVRALQDKGQGRFGEADMEDMPGDEMHRLCRQCGVPTVIVTLGARGCFVSEPGGFIFIPAYREMTVVDTTGAGDAFCGGFAAGLVRHRGDRVAAARLGSAVAALSITKAGAAHAMPTRDELRRFLRAQQPEPVSPVREVPARAIPGPA